MLGPYDAIALVQERGGEGRDKSENHSFTYRDVARVNRQTMGWFGLGQREDGADKTSRSTGYPAVIGGPKTGGGTIAG